MIKLRLNRQGQAPVVYTFKKPSLSIGKVSSSGHPLDLALPLDDESIANVLISEENERFIVQNIGNDPYTTLNGLPFGKKAIKTQDILQFGEISIDFLFLSIKDLPEGENCKTEFSTLHRLEEAEPAEATEKKSCLEAEGHLLEVLEKAMASKHVAVHAGAEDKDFRTLPPLPPMEVQNVGDPFDLDVELKKLEKMIESSSKTITSEKLEIKHLDISSIEELLERVEGLEKKAPEETSPLKDQAEFHPAAATAAQEDSKTPQLPEEEEPLPAFNKPRQSLKDYYLSEFDDENLDDDKEKKNPGPIIWNSINWRIVGWSLLALAIIGLSIAGFFYIAAAVRNEEEEIRAAEGISDVVMALSHAQITHASPQNQNWSDPEFLKSNLAAVLAPEYLPLSSLDSHGQFSNTNYILRIYTNSDLSQFLAIAQPSSNNLLQWLTPSHSIIVDSKSMELHKTDDLKTLNRLLANATLDQTNSSEISALVKQSSLIPLDLLANKLAHQGFSPPKALAFLRPGAENLIYNAPRYYNFGEPILRKAISLYDVQENADELAVLKADMQGLENFPNIVLYSSGGIQMAIAAQKALSTFLPQHPFLFAYLQFDSKGILANSHMLIDDTPLEAISLADTPYPPAEVREDELQTGEAQASSQTARAALLNTYMDQYLHSLYEERKQVLKEINSAMIDLLQKESENPVPYFSGKLKELQASYQEKSNAYLSKILKAISLTLIIEATPPEDYDAPFKNSPSSDISVSPAPQNRDIAPPAHDSESASAAIDKSHPLYYRLASLNTARQQTLRPLGEKIIRLLDAHEASPSGIHGPAEKLEEMQKNYQAVDENLKAKIIKTLAQLYKEYSYLPLSTFMNYVKAAGLGYITEEYAAKTGLELSEAQPEDTQLQEGLHGIQNANNLQELEDAVAKEIDLLTALGLSETSKVINYQQLIHNAVFRKLEQFLLKPSTPLTADDYTSQNKIRLSHIMQSAWMTGADETDYFLNEFEQLAGNRVP